MLQWVLIKIVFSELLRRTAEQTLIEITQLMFLRYFIFFVPAQNDKNARWISLSRLLRGSLFQPRRRQLVLVLLYIIMMFSFQKHRLYKNHSKSSLSMAQSNVHIMFIVRPSFSINWLIWSCDLFGHVVRAHAQSLKKTNFAETLTWECPYI